MSDAERAPTGGPARRLGARVVAAGAWAALRTPLWLRGDRLARLLAPPAAPAVAVPPAARRAIRASRLALRVLARTPSPWRSTCLYRSAAECLVLRRFGVPARLRIGVRPGGARGHADADIDAHAWVEVAGGPDAAEAAGYVEFERPGAPAAPERRRPDAEMSTPPSARVVPLLDDGALVLRAEPSVAAAVERWLPLSGERLATARGARRTDEPAPASRPRVDDRVRAGADRAPPRPSARIDVVEAAAGTEPAPSVRPTLRLGGAAAWVDDADARVVLGRPGRGADGWIDLEAGRARIAVPPPGARTGESDGADDRVDAYSLLTVTSALLLGRLGRALLHAAAVVPPGDDGAWLLVGDARAGKTTALANLVRAGWDWLSDDHVVLARAAAGGGARVEPRTDGASRNGGARDAAVVRVDGWPRPFHLDEGWPDGEPTGSRRAVDPSGIGPGRPRASARLAGLLFPRVEPDSTTRARPASAGAALGRLIRQSPWLLADRAPAAAALALLRAAASRPAHTLRLGRDGYADAAALQRVLATVVAGHP